MEIENWKHVWVVYTNTDCTEGRGRLIPIYVCDLEATAVRLAKKRYIQGSDAPVRKQMAVMVNGAWMGPVEIELPTQDDRSKQIMVDKKQEAIKKAKDAGLTDDEISLIGGLQ